MPCRACALKAQKRSRLNRITSTKMKKSKPCTFTLNELKEMETKYTGLILNYIKSAIRNYRLNCNLYESQISKLLKEIT